MCACVSTRAWGYLWVRTRESEADRNIFWIFHRPLNSLIRKNSRRIKKKKKTKKSKNRINFALTNFPGDMSVARSLVLASQIFIYFFFFQNLFISSVLKWSLHIPILQNQKKRRKTKENEMTLWRHCVVFDFFYLQHLMMNSKMKYYATVVPRYSMTCDQAEIKTTWQILFLLFL